MKKRFNWIVILAVLFLAVPFIFSCGKATSGYNAQYGDAVQFDLFPASPQNITTEECQTVQISVIGTRGLEGEELTRPLGGIQVQLDCNNCEVWDKTDGSTYIISETPLEQKAIPLLISTTALGIYQYVTCYLAPAAYGVETYDAQLIANIGVDRKIQDFTVVEP